MVELLGVLLAAGVSVAVTFGLYAVVGRVRTRSSEHRLEAAAKGDAIDIPVRLRGVALSYPGYWRSGRLDVKTCRWTPRIRWGIPVSLAGARCIAQGTGGEQDGLYEFFAGDPLLTCVDVRGRPFQLSVFAANDAKRIKRCLAQSRADRGPGHIDRAADVGSVRLRWLRQRIPLTAVILYCAAILTAAYWLAPLLSDRVVEGSVLRNGGAEYLCEVGWYDPTRDVGGRGYSDCGYLEAGDRLELRMMGWPRTDVVDDVESAITAGAIFGGAPLMMGIVMTGAFLQQRLKFARRTRANADDQ
jgi:hypothetical protein